MNNYNFCRWVFGLVFAGLSFAYAQDNTVRIPLKTFTKPAYDLVDAKGKNLSVAELKSQFDTNVDLSKLNPIENKFWQNTDLPANSVIDQNLHNLMPSERDALAAGLNFDSFVGVVRELGMYAINVRSAKDPSQVYRLKSGLQVHASLLKAALLRKIGIYQESPKYFQSVKLKFENSAQLNSFIMQAFCVAGPDEVAISCLSIDPESRGFLSDKNETDNTVIVHGSYLEKLNAEAPNLFDGLTPSNQNTISLYGQSRAYRALIVPYVIADVGESINRFSAQAVAVRGGWAHLNFTFSTDFDGITSYDDVRWVLRKMSELTDQDWTEIVEAAKFPHQLTAVVKAKLLHRYNNMMETFFSKEEHRQLVRVQIPTLEINSGDGIVVSGKVMTEQIAGYPQRFSHGERQSPFESGDFMKYLKIRAQSTAIESALSQFSSRLLEKQRILNLDVVGVDVGPNGYKPLIDASVVSFGANANANRIITTGTYYGSDAKVQMVDSLTLSASAGYMRILDGMNGINTNFGGGVAYMRNFVHVTPINSMTEAQKIPLRNLYVPTKLKELTGPLKDGKLNEFLNALKVGEVFTVTDFIGLSARIGFTTGLDALVGFLPTVTQPTLGLSADSSKVILRQIQFIKTVDGLQVYIRDQNSRAFGLELNVNYFINLLKIRAQTTKEHLHTKAYLLNYNSELITKVDNLDVIPDEDLQKKVDAMRGFGNKAALALRSLLVESSDKELATNFKYQSYAIDHELNAKELRFKLLWLRANYINEEHLLTINKPMLPIEINGVKVINEPVKVVTYKKGRMNGSDKFGFGLEVADAALKEKLGSNAPASLVQASQNPSQMPFGKATWTTVRADTELTHTRPGALPSVAVVEQVWGGWSLGKSELGKILNAANEKSKGVTFANFPLIPKGALQHVDKVDFFRVTSHLSVLPEGLDKIKELMVFTGDSEEGQRKFLANLYKNLIQIIGNGDLKAGREVYLPQCKQRQIKPGSKMSSMTTNTYTYEWLHKVGFECLEPWVRQLIKLSKNFPKSNSSANSSTDLRKQNKWMAEVLYVINAEIPLASLLNYLQQDKFIYYLEVTGFRSGDEDGDDGFYVSNVYGEPSKSHPFANGLISVLADKSKISITELEQTTGGF